MPSILQLNLLGTSSIVWQDRSLEINKQKAIACLYYLASNDKAISRDELAEILWSVGRLPNLRQLLYIIRRLDGAELWFEDGDPLSLNSEQIDCDVVAFRQAVKAQDFEQALKLYKGPFLEEFRVRNAPNFQDWLELERTQLQSIYMQCLSTQAHTLEQAEKPQEALDLLETLVDLDPLNEDAHRRIMMLQWRAGNIKAALGQFESCRRVLAEELGLEPVSSTLKLFETIQTQADTSIPVEFESTEASLQITPKEATLDFIGRQKEIAELDELFTKHRLVSIIGPGGMGKTSLATEFRQHSQLAQVKHTVFVSLSALRNTRFIAAAIANSLNISFKGPLDPLAQLTTALRHQEILLVLDNLEQLLDADVIVKTLLDDTTHLQILVTSRRVLGLQEEQTLYLQGLSFPEVDDAQAIATDAVRFFVKSAHVVDASFLLSPNNQEAVFRICRLLQGLPLGLELAAGWLRFYDCEGLAELLEKDALELENPGLDLEERHTSLRYIMEHSWACLSEAEKSILSSLAVCRGGFTVQAARAVAGADISILSSLRHQSLLQTDGQGRYSRHPLVYEFSYEKLQTSAFLNQVSVHHARYYLNLLSEQNKNILGTTPGSALDLIEEEFENIHIAWLYAANAGWFEELLTASDTLSLYADMRVRFHDAIDLFDEAAQALETQEEGQVTRALILADKGSHLNRLNRHTEALALVNEAMQSIDVKNIVGQDRLLRLKGSCLYGLADYPKAKVIFEEILKFSKKHYPDQLSRDHRALANLEVCLGNYSSAETNYRKAIKLDRQNGYIIGLAINLNNLSELLILGNQSEQLNEAKAMIDESLAYVEGVDLHLVPYLNLNKAQLAFQQNEFDTAQHFAELCYKDAKTYAQVNLQSRSKTLLATIAHQQKQPDAAIKHSQQAMYIAAENNATASLMQAFIVYSQLADKDTGVLFLQCAAENPASEYSDKQKAQQLLNRLELSTIDNAKQQSLSIPQLLAIALPQDSFVYHKDTLILED